MARSSQLSAVDEARVAPPWLRRIDAFVRLTIRWLASTLLVLMVTFTIYTVVMRYVFHDPPFWGDTVSMFCNIWLVLMAYALAVRDREDIASEGIYAFLPSRSVVVLKFAWQAMTLAFGVVLFWFGLDAALNVPGQYWELGGLPKKAPMMVLPLCGGLVVLMTACNAAEDLFGWHIEPKSQATPGAGPR
jgi:TRAP-type C4-dicarboxylate transport system permease small subunit